MNLKFDEQSIIDCLPNEIATQEFIKHSQLAITHSKNSDSWYDGVGSLYDFQKNVFVDTTSSFTILNKYFVGTYIEEVIDSVKSAAVNDSVSIGRIRLMVLAPRSCYTLHQDPEDFRYHIPLITNKNNFFVIDNIIDRMEDVGQLYRFRTKEMHTAVNASRQSRFHLVFDTY
jgi:hypothetical protein